MRYTKAILIGGAVGAVLFSLAAYNDWPSTAVISGVIGGMVAAFFLAWIG